MLPIPYNSIQGQEFITLEGLEEAQRVGAVVGLLLQVEGARLLVELAVDVLALTAMLVDSATVVMRHMMEVLVEEATTEAEAEENVE